MKLLGSAITEIYDHVITITNYPVMSSWYHGHDGVMSSTHHVVIMPGCAVIMSL